MKIYKAMILIIIVLISLNQLANKKLVRDSSSINTIYLNASKFNNTSIYSQLNHETLSLVNPQSMINPPSIGESPKINLLILLSQLTTHLEASNSSKYAG